MRTRGLLLVCGFYLGVGGLHGAEAPAEAAPAPLDLARCRQLVLAQNLAVQASRWGWQASVNLYRSEWGAFEPAAVGGVTRLQNERENTREQQISQNNVYFEEERKEYNAGVETALPTGGRVQFGYTLQDIYNNLRVRPDDPLDREYEGFLGASLVQPLLRNAGLGVALARLRLARAESEIAFQEFRKQLLLVMARAEIAYWSLYLAQEQERLGAESVTLAEKVLADNRARVGTGKMAELEVSQAQAGVAMRRTRVSEAHLKRIAAMDELRTFFAQACDSNTVALVATAQPALDAARPDYVQGVRGALALHPDYLIRKHVVEQERVRVQYAGNQRWPQVDLKASYGLNGLGEDAGGAWDDISDNRYEAWSVGVELRLPLLGDTRARRELAAARCRRAQALVNLKQAEIEIVNSLDAAVRKVTGSRDQAANYKQVADFSRQVLETEMSRLEAGKSDSRKVLDVEDDLAEARQAELESIVRCQTALIEYESAAGDLLVKRQADPQEPPAATP